MAYLKVWSQIGTLICYNSMLQLLFLFISFFSFLGQNPLYYPKQFTLSIWNHDQNYDSPHPQYIFSILFLIEVDFKFSSYQL